MRIFSGIFLLLVFSSLAVGVFAQKKLPIANDDIRGIILETGDGFCADCERIITWRTVTIFIKNCPPSIFRFLKRLTERCDFVESDDAKNDYLRFGTNVPFPPDHAEMALLKRMNGSFYIVIPYTDDDENDGQAKSAYAKLRRNGIGKSTAPPRQTAK